METLDEFMKRRGWTDQHLAEQVGRDRSTITRIRLGHAAPSLDLAVKIERLTHGKVKPASFVGASASTSDDAA